MRYGNPLNQAGFTHRQQRQIRAQLQARKEQLATLSEIQATLSHYQATPPRMRCARCGTALTASLQQLQRTLCGACRYSQENPTDA